MKIILDAQKRKVEILNREEGHLNEDDGYDCPKCRNRGRFFVVSENGCMAVRECECMAVRRSKRFLKKSGLADMVGRYTLETWRKVEPFQQVAEDVVMRYIARHDGWLLVSGNPGTGKTHICTAACLELINSGIETRYMLWRDVSTRAKAAVNDATEYARIVDPLKTVRCLYIDDLFKCGKGQEPTVGDVNLAFEILNYRYNDSRLYTIISTERSAEELLDIDEAVGSRIYERSKGYYLDFAGRQNWRIK